MLYALKTELFWQEILDVKESGDNLQISVQYILHSDHYYVLHTKLRSTISLQKALMFVKFNSS
jgi:hypothetical protein